MVCHLPADRTAVAAHDKCVYSRLDSYGPLRLGAARPHDVRMGFMMAVTIQLSVMLENKRGVHEIHWSERDDVGGKIDTLKFQTGQGGITLARSFEVRRIEVDAKDSLGARGIDMIKPIAAGNAENCERSGATERESSLEEVRERRELLDFRGAHVAFIIGERNV